LVDQQGWGAGEQTPFSRLNRLAADANRRRPAGVAYLASDLLEHVELISAEQLAQAGLESIRLDLGVGIQVHP
jgi:hypothetical protein